jgi:anti-anti-sigma factor
MADVLVHHDDPVAVVELVGEHDIASVERFDAAMREAMGSVSSSCMVDLSRLEFCDSSIVHALVNWSKEAQVSEREALAIVVGGETTPVSRILATVGLLTRLPVFATSQAARLALLDGRRPRHDRPLGWLSDRELTEARETALRDVREPGTADAQDAAIHRLSDIVREQQYRRTDAARDPGG